MALLEVWTVPLERPRLDRIIAAARARKSFRILRRERTVVTLRGMPVPNLNSFDLELTDNIFLKWDGALVDQEELAQFLRLKENLRGKATVCSARVDVNESGGHPADGHYDTKLSFGDDAFGPFMELVIGSASKGWEDPVYRKRLFQMFLAAIGAASRVDAITGAEKGLDFQLSQAKVVEFRDLPEEEHTRTLREGGLVVRRAGSPLNAEGITVWDSRRDLAAAVLAVHAILGPERVAGGEVSVSCTRQQYEQVGAVLAQSTCLPWKALFMGRCRYDLNSLNDALAEMDSFILRAFTLKEKGTGTVYAEIWSDCGSLKLLFCAEPMRGPQEELLHSLITELADGDNVIDLNRE